MAIEQIDLELIQDNPYQARLTYHKKDIDELAHSIKTHGLLQVPPGRRKDGNIELGFGHLRRRAFSKLAKKEPEKWGKMPVDIRDLTDDQMAMFALEENLKRRDISPLETARAVDKYLNSFPSKTEVEVAGYLNMAQPSVANMRRVLRLPEKFLEKIDQGVLSFTQGKELLIFEKMVNAEEMMKAALDGLRTGNKAYGHSNTVEGLQVSIHEVVSRHFRPLDKKWEGYRWDLLFDTRGAGCLKCDKIIRTHPTKSETAHYCLDGLCWDRHQEEHRERAATEAKAKMEAEIVKRAAESITIEAKESIPQGIPVELKEKPDATDAFLEQVAEELEARVDERDRQMQAALEETREEANLERPVGELPCETCTKDESCDRNFFHVADDDSGRLICEQWECDFIPWALPKEPAQAVPEDRLEQDIRHRIAEAPAPAQQEIPEDILTMAREKAGTRAEVLDLTDICTGERYWRQLKQGYADLSAELRLIDDPEECLERCTHGFHYAFDSKASEQRVIQVCSDTKCLAKKKAAFTRAKNADGQARKKAETKAVKEAIAQTTIIDRPRIKLILLAQMDGQHCTRSYYDGGKKPETWLWEKISAGTPAIERKRADFFKRIDKLSDDELAKLMVEFMFYYLVDHGDIGTYEIKSEVPLGWLGVKIELKEEKGTAGVEGEGNSVEVSTR